MKKVVDYLKLDTVSIDLKSRDKKAVIKEVFENIAVCDEVLDKNKCYEDLLEREKLGSTGIGEGFAIPHAKTNEVNIFFMFLSPNELSQEYLILLAKISRFIRQDDFKSKLLSATSKNEIYEILSSREE